MSPSAMTCTRTMPNFPSFSLARLTISRYQRVQSISRYHVTNDATVTSLLPLVTYSLAKCRQKHVSKCHYISQWCHLSCLFIGRTIVGVTTRFREFARGISDVGSVGRSGGNNAAAFVGNVPLLTSIAEANKYNAEIPKCIFFFFFFVIICHLDIFPLDAFSLIFILCVTLKYEYFRSRL